MLLSPRPTPKPDKKRLQERRKRRKIDLPKRRLPMNSSPPKELLPRLLRKMPRKSTKLRWKQESTPKLRPDLHSSRDTMLSSRNKLPMPLKNREKHLRQNKRKKLRREQRKRQRPTNRLLKLWLNSKKNKRLPKLIERELRRKKKPLLWPKSLKQRN